MNSLRPMHDASYQCISARRIKPPARCTRAMPLRLRQRPCHRPGAASRCRECRSSGRSSRCRTRRQRSRKTCLDGAGEIRQGELPVCSVRRSHETMSVPWPVRRPARARLWGDELSGSLCVTPPPPTPPRKGEGSAPSSPRAGKPLRPHERDEVPCDIRLARKSQFPKHFQPYSPVQPLPQK